MAEVKNGLLYSKEHEWVRVEGEEAYIGLTDYAQHSLGEIVYVELPEEDESYDKDSALGVIESVKAASDIYMPLTGTVVEANEDLEDAPESLNNDPYGAWIAKVKIEDESELEELMDADQYKEFCE